MQCFLPCKAQDRCGVIEIMQDLRNKKAILETDDQFENWLRQRKERSDGRNNASGKYIIPVVVHVIHNGENVGVGSNISDQQIISQIKVLNNDFNRLNADASSTPSEFLSVASNLNIEFVLAKQAPDGFPSNGIVRAKGTKTQWTTTNDATLKALSYWPAEDYMNIWVANLSSSLLGYAQFPVSDLAGLEDAEDNRLTDGVVIDYASFGSVDDDDDGTFTLTSDYDRGRTATHEVGHFFGLRHIWGDDNGACSGDDYADDTPNQGNSTSACPSHPQTSCTVHKMFQNYMDYTTDACMNLFTQNQVGRMITVLENSPRRASLLTSLGSVDPVIYANNLAIIEIVEPNSDQCERVATPVLKLKNTGSNAVTTAKIQIKLNGVITKGIDLTFDSPLESIETRTVTLPQVDLNLGSTAFEFEILEMNNVEDENSSDNILSITTFVPYSITIPFVEDFILMPSHWNILNSDESITWATVSAPNGEENNTAQFMNFFTYQNAIDQTDIITSPVFDLSQATSPYLNFEVAYATSQQNEDGLKVYVVIDCQWDATQDTPVYSKAGSTLATVSSSSSSFTPNGKDQWRKEIIDLRSFIGQSHVQLAFVSVNGGGNNLYIDNITVVGSISENVSIANIVTPAPVQCETTTTPVLQVKNNSEVDITSLNVNYTLNNGSEQTLAVNGLSGFSPGTETTITLPSLDLNPGNNTIDFNLSEPNGYTDIDPSDNKQLMMMVVNTASDFIPLRENFDSNFEDQWTIVNPKDGMNWAVTSTNNNQSIYFNAVDNVTIGDEAWLVSPVLDFSVATQASLFFDLSYKYLSDEGNKNNTDKLSVLASTDCGVTYNNVLFENTAESLTVEETTTALPASATDWKRNYLNLTSLTGESNVRFAFVFKNGNGSNIYLDNIEFFTSDSPVPQSVDNPFAVYGTDPESPSDFYVTFNLADRQTVSYELVDAMGRRIVGEDLSDVLNQTYTINAPQATTGVYLFRVRIGKAYYTTKVYMRN